MKEIIDIYTKYNIDVNRLTRDYLKFPLKKIPHKTGGKPGHEIIPKEDFVYLFIECNLSYNDFQQYFHVSETYVRHLYKKYNILKSDELRKQKQTKIDIYNEYNVDVNRLSRDYQKFPLKKFKGEDGRLQYIHPPKEDFVYLYIECNLPSKVLQQYFNVSENYITKLGKLYNIKKPYNQRIENQIKTNLEIYGVENYSQTDEFKELFNDEEFVRRSKQKQYETKKKNNSFGKSEEENEIYSILLTKFKEVVRQYKSDLYPFPCDFYIPEKDLYIEYQGYFQHGKEPYLGTDEQNKIVESWEENGSEQYISAIKTWTIHDPLKRSTAKQNNLNWLEFFTMKEFTQWFETI